MLKFAPYKYVPVLIFQLVMIGLYFKYAKYSGGDNATMMGFEGTHVMIFIGFGFLMTFLKRYSYSALGFNLLLAAMSIQWAIICQSLFEMKNDTIIISKRSLFEADVMAATVLITFGAVLGLASGVQLVIICIVETTMGCVNMWLIDHVFKATDVGGSMAIHMFGAYFGMGVSIAFRLVGRQRPRSGTHDLSKPSYQSDVTAMIGTLFLWVYWPSFNSALCTSMAQYERATINTYLGLAAATVIAFFMSSALSHTRQGKFDMVHIQNSTLAGGVAVGAICNFMINPGIALSVGAVAGFLSVFGYMYFTPCLERMGIMDTCGVNNLHGMPGILSGILSIVFASSATVEEYKDELSVIFMHPTARDQAVAQVSALGSTFLLALMSGLVTGILAKALDSLEEDEKYEDNMNWDLPN